MDYDCSVHRDSSRYFQNDTLLHGLSMHNNNIAFIHHGKRFQIQVANNLSSRKKAFGFMYQIYRKIGYGRSHPSRLWFSLHEILPYTATVTLLYEAQIQAVVTIVLDSTFALPADDVFKQKLDALRKNKCKLAEVFSFGICSDLRNDDLVKGKLVHIIYLISKYIFNATHWLITVVPSHAQFYCVKMQFNKINGLGFHRKTGVNCNLLVLKLDKFKCVSNEIRKKTLAKYFWPYNDESRIINHLRQELRPISSEEISYFRSVRPDIEFQPNDNAEIAKAIKEIYSPETANRKSSHEKS